MHHRRFLVLAGLSSLAAFCSTREASATDVGGHVGVATPIVQVLGRQVDVIGRNFGVLAVPIGVTVKFDSQWAFDFETVVATPLAPTGGTTALMVDPGIIYNWGPLATGLRVAFQIGAPPNVGVIPLINVGLLTMGRATWFVEAAFPIFNRGGQLHFFPVLHTGVGF